MRSKAVSWSTITIALVFLAATISRAQTYNVIYGFGSDPNDPLNPELIGTISQGRDGRVYTTSQSGGRAAKTALPSTSAFSVSP